MTLADAEHLGSASRTDIPSCRPAILHDDRFWIFHFPFGLAFNTISLHFDPSRFII
jgi:hypothetical protein